MCMMLTTTVCRSKNWYSERKVQNKKRVRLDVSIWDVWGLCLVINYQRKMSYRTHPTPIPSPCWSFWHQVFPNFDKCWPYDGSCWCPQKSKGWFVPCNRLSAQDEQPDPLYPYSKPILKLLRRTSFPYFDKFWPYYVVSWCWCWCPQKPKGFSLAVDLLLGRTNEALRVQKPDRNGLIITNNSSWTLTLKS